MNDQRKLRVSELRIGDKLWVENKDLEPPVGSDFLVVECLILWLFPVKRLQEMKFYANDTYPMSYLNRKEIYWKLKP